MMLKKRYFLTCLILVVNTVNLGGCQKDIDYKKSLISAKECCQSYSDLKYRKLIFEQSIDYHIGDENSEAMFFPEGKSFFAAVQLPDYKGPYEVQIDSLPIHNKLFVPTMLHLNKNYEVIKKTVDSSFEYSNGRSSYRFFINEEDKQNKYIILYTRTGIVGKQNQAITTSQSTVPIYAGGYVLYYTSHSEQKNAIKNARGGNLNISALEYKLRKIEQAKD